MEHIPTVIENALIYFIIGYCLYFIYTYLTREKPDDNVTSEVESFQNNYPGHSLSQNQENMQLCFPGEFTQILLRPWSMDTVSKNILNNLVIPTLQRINKQEKRELQLQQYNSIVTRQYNDGIVYTVEFFVQDIETNTTFLMGAEYVNAKTGLLHCNYIRPISHNKIINTECSLLNNDLMNYQAKVDIPISNLDVQSDTKNKLHSLQNTIYPL